MLPSRGLSFKNVFGCRSLSVGSCARVFITESDPFSALQACIEGVQMVAVVTVTTLCFLNRNCNIIA